jgi:lipid-A-disaccharide synthase
MTPKRFMLIAGESSGDVLAAELVGELRAALRRQNNYTTDVQPLRSDLAPQFFGAGGSRLADAGVEMSINLVQHSMVGIPGVKDLLKFKGFRDQLFALALERQPHAIICVDFNSFNLSYAAHVKQHIRNRHGTFNNWNPKIIKYVSPQVWASRENRAYQMARDFDLLLSIFPFEKDWYAKRVPKFPVEFVGHPIMDRYQDFKAPTQPAESAPLLLLLPGSRARELKRHLPPMLGGLKIIQSSVPNVRARMVLSSPALVELAGQFSIPSAVEVRCGGLPESLAEAAAAIASTGTVTMECAYFGVPAVTLYKASAIEYEIGKRLIKVKSMTMPNLLADEPVFPEFIQDAATPENLARAALELLRDPVRRGNIRAKLKQVIASLGPPGAGHRAAEAILRLTP